MSDRPIPTAVDDAVTRKPRRNEQRGRIPDFSADQGGDQPPNIVQARQTGAPTRPAQGPIIDGDIAKWKAEFFLVKGWKSKKDQQVTLKSGLDALMSQQLGPAGPDNATALGKDKKVDAGPDFKKYMKALAAYESAPEPRDAKVTADLKSAAELIVTKAATAKPRILAEPANARKIEICRNKLAQLDLQAKCGGIGDPPWDSKTAMTVASLKAQADFASLPMGNQSAEELKGGGVNSAYWVNSAGNGPSKPAKTFLFKPAMDKQDRKGIPRGGEPAREALTGRAADVLNGMTGIDFKVPETHIIQVPRDKFTGTMNDDVIGKNEKQPLTGSLQQFAKTDGELRENSPLKANAVPAERCQELAILDIVTLNLDRHGGNFLMTGDDKKADLVPIDNGLSFPSSAEEFGKISTSHNALLGVPGAHKPFSADMQGKIAKIDPSALPVALKTEVKTIESVHGSAKGMVDDAAIALSRRSTMFLKLAAATLNPASVQVAMGQNASALFDPTIDDTEFQRRAAQIISNMVADQPALAEYFLMSAEESKAAKKTLTDTGWGKEVAANPQLAMAVLKAGSPPPAKPVVVPLDEGTIAADEIAKMKASYKSATSPKDIPAWRQIVQAGGAAKLVEIFDRAGTDPVERRFYLTSNIDEAANLLAQFAAATAIKAVADPVAGNATLLDRKLDLVTQMADIMSASIKPLVLRDIQAARQSGDVAEANKVRDQVIATLQLELIPEIESFWKFAGQGNEAEAAKTNADKMKKDVWGGGILVTRTKLDELERKYNYPR